MNETWPEKLDQAIDARYDRMVKLRRLMHAEPELSAEERETSLRLYQSLGDEGFTVRMGADGCGVIADMDTSAGQPTIAVRGDIDALRIHDEKQVEYRSRREGLMHACGHDAHTSIVWGALCALNDMRKANLLPWPIGLRGIFQPAEEICVGAREMIRVGALEGVDAILATHVDPSRHLGRIGLRKGVFTANCDEMEITIVGRGGHAARPHEASDPIAAAAQLINALYLFIARRTDSQHAVVVTIGQIIGGENANVIPEQVTLRGTVRTLDRSVRSETFSHICRLSEGIGATSETKINVEFGLGCHSVVNDPQLVELLRNAGHEVLGEEGVESIRRPSMGSEDFAFYAEQIPAAMFRLGCTSSRAGGSPLHSTTFDIDEETLRIGARILARAVIRWSKPPSQSRTL